MPDSRLPGHQLLALTEEELQRIVLDVHDGPVQYLFAALGQLTALRARLEADGAPSAYAAPVARTVESVEAALADIRRTVSTFRAPNLAERGLTGVVEELIVGHEARTGSRVELTMDAELPAHIGLRGMRERLALVGGTLRVESRPGRGTRVRAAVPLDA